MKYLATIFFLVVSLQCLAQVDTVRHTRRDSQAVRVNNVTADTHHARRADTALPKIKPATARVDSFVHAIADTVKSPRRASKPDTSVKAGVAGTGILDSSGITALKNDSLRADTTAARTATIQKKLVKPVTPPPGMPGTLRIRDNRDELFYILAGALLFLGIIKVAYPKYFQNTFRFIFQTSLRQKQTPEQIVQGYIPGFLLNLLFFIVGGITIALFCRRMLPYNFLKGPLWLVILFCTAVLAAVYLVKYLVAVFAGWVFNAKQAAGTYSFIVFLINRFIGIVLLPLVVFIAFYNDETQVVMFTIAAAILILMLLYRYILSLTLVRKNLKVSALHFFIYLCAVEVMPLLVIFKVLFSEIPSNK